MEKLGRRTTSVRGWFRKTTNSPGRSALEECPVGPRRTGTNIRQPRCGQLTITALLLVAESCTSPGQRFNRNFVSIGASAPPASPIFALRCVATCRSRALLSSKGEAAPVASKANIGRVRRLYNMSGSCAFCPERIARINLAKSKQVSCQFTAHSFSFTRSIAFRWQEGQRYIRLLIGFRNQFFGDFEDNHLPVLPCLFKGISNSGRTRRYFFPLP